MRLFGRGAAPSQGLSGEITRAWQDPLFHQQHPLAAALLQGLFPHLCPCTRIIPGNGNQTIFGRAPGMAGGQSGTRPDG